MKLNLGCSDDHKVGYVNVDRVEPADEVADLNYPWPWGNSSVDEIYAHDVFEHISSPYARGKIWAMNEAHRVLKPGGILDLAVPCVSLLDGTVNPGAFADPTHASFWTWDDIFYFSEQFNTRAGERGRLGPAYGITALFRAPRMERDDRAGWFVAGHNKGLAWFIRQTGHGQERRAKIIARLEAVK